MERAASNGRGVARGSLRTYSRRAASASSIEPASKKPQADEADAIDVNIHSIAERFTQQTQAPMHQQGNGGPELPTVVPAPHPKKGSILNYFKVRSPSSGTSTACAQSSDPSIDSSEKPIPSATPPSSPPTFETARKRPRRLTTKPALPKEETLKEHRDGGDDDNDTNSIDNASAKNKKENHLVLKNASSNLLNRKRSREADRSDAGKRGIKKPKAKQATVQTTLSLSLTEKQFIECTECSMLYNPYHEKDVKTHKKQHTAMVRAKNSRIKGDA